MLFLKLPEVGTMAHTCNPNTGEWGNEEGMKLGDFRFKASLGKKQDSKPQEQGANGNQFCIVDVSPAIFLLFL